MQQKANRRNAAGVKRSIRCGNGNGGRRMMALGAGFSFLLNWLTSFGIGFKSLGAAWGLNGLAQSMGWAPGSRLVSNLFGDHERGRAFGLFVLAAGLSSVLAFVTSLVVLDVLKLNWRWIFRLPVILMLMGGLIVWFVARDRPSALGFEDFPEDEKKDDNASAAGEAQRNSPETTWQRYRAALTNGRLLLAGLAIGFQTTVRYGLLIWVPVYFLGDDFKSDSFGKWISIALPVGMALGALTSGWASDRFCGSRRSGIIVLFMILAATAAMGMFLLPPGHLLGVPMLFLACLWTAVRVLGTGTGSTGSGESRNGSGSDEFFRVCNGRARRTSYRLDGSAQSLCNHSGHGKRSPRFSNRGRECHLQRSTRSPHTSINSNCSAAGK